MMSENPPAVTKIACETVDGHSIRPDSREMMLNLCKQPISQRKGTLMTTQHEKAEQFARLQHEGKFLLANALFAAH
jgi:hypothetical protein